MSMNPLAVIDGQVFYTDGKRIYVELSEMDFLPTPEIGVVSVRTSRFERLNADNCTEEEALWLERQLEDSYVAPGCQRRYRLWTHPSGDWEVHMYGAEGPDRRTDWIAAEVFFYAPYAAASGRAHRARMLEARKTS